MLEYARLRTPVACPPNVAADVQAGNEASALYEGHPGRFAAHWFRPPYNTITCPHLEDRIAIRPPFLRRTKRFLREQNDDQPMPFGASKLSVTTLD
ncbi:hypothetical protein PHET_07981 [Paragonimus heterotremus]|uniref:Uncharacterized protein n=1 Tax=Paragonimus heterotremus TaxID=100268 RepID=A0A8J4WGT3_9TREM|nr:hypothetical protein PHET_07981 [Paragonimus heterotremus]